MFFFHWTNAHTHIYGGNSVPTAAHRINDMTWNDKPVSRVCAIVCFRNAITIGVYCSNSKPIAIQTIIIIFVYIKHNPTHSNAIISLFQIRNSKNYYKHAEAVGRCIGGWLVEIMRMARWNDGNHIDVDTFIMNQFIDSFCVSSEHHC